MIKEVCHDLKILSLPSTQLLESDDLSVIEDLKDTLIANRDKCVGMAANMIGVLKNVIVFIDEEGFVRCMVNPVIVKKSEPYDAKEGCLSLDEGERPCKRYKKINVEFLSEDFKRRKKSYKGFVAEIIQHEVDHLTGIII